ncbi:MAG TPA: acetylxylan esterase [Atribacteraceae bacterium]|nr:acetylxylan esterase [Atribacteraceae bacterium]
MSSQEKENSRQELLGLLGDLPPHDRPVSCDYVAVDDRPKFRIERLLLELNGIEPVPAYFMTPTVKQSKLPAILYNHAHGFEYHIGKEEIIQGRTFLQNPPYGEVLCSQGYAVLCIDHWGFGERQGRTEMEIFKTMLWEGKVMWGMMVYDSLRALDYLVSRPEVDGERVGTLGISMGSTMGWWISALDDRIKACVDLCCLTDFQALIATRGLDGHGIYYYVPRLLKHFTTTRINALIAPRPHLSLAGLYDPLTPVAGLDRINQDLQEIYRREGAPEAWRLIQSHTGHFETAAMRSEVLAFLKRWL